MLLQAEALFDLCHFERADAALLSRGGNAVVAPPPASSPPVVEVLAAPASAPSVVAEPESPPAPAELMKRLTIDITDNLHRRIKATCANRGTKMVDEIRIDRKSVV